MKKLNITFCSFPDYGGNAKALYDFMVKKKYTNHRYVWIVYEEETKKKLDKRNIECFLIGTEEFKKYISSTDVFFTTQGNLDADKTDKSLYIELWHGVGGKPVGYLCENPTDEDIRGYNNIRKIIDYIIVPNDFWKVIFAATFNIEAKRVKSFGMPIFDYFINSDGKKNLSKVTQRDISNFSKILFYMPTFKSGFNHEDVKELNIKNIFNFDIYEEKILDEYLKENNYLLCVKRHPGENNIFNEYLSENIVYIKENMLIENEISINEVINSCDLMITDYSSIGTEFIFLDRPVLFLTHDFKEYVKNRGIIFSNFDFWTVGPKCNDIKSFLKETKKLLQDKTYYQKERYKAKKLWYGDLVAGGNENICNFLFDLNGNINTDVEKYKNPEIQLEKNIENLNQNIISTETKLLDQEKINQELQLELNNITNSKAWKILAFLMKFKFKK